MPPRQPVRIRPRRTPGDVLAGLGALVLLAALVGGVPYALLRLAGPPLPPELLDLDVLTSQVGTSTIIAILVLLVWLAWLQLAVCVIVEVYAGIRRVGMPAQVPFSGGTQALANRLVSAALLLFTVSAVVVPIARPGGLPAGPPVAAAAADALSALPAPVAGERAPLAPVAEVKKVYVVQPPHGRHHESLWEIAEKCLGDGRRYPEVYRLNQHKEQPDGSRLHMADLIRPGWVLDMPDDARNVHIVPVDQPRDETLKDHPYKPAELDGRTQHVTPGARDLPAGEETGTGHHTGRHTQVSPPQDTSVLPGDGSGDRRSGDPGRVERPAPAETGRGTAEPSRTGERADPARTGERATGREHAPDDPGRGTVTERPVPPDWAAEPETGAPLLDYLAGASLLAAGVLAALGGRRRRQLWERAFGRRVVRPRDDAAEAEVALRIGADAPGSRMLDLGLRLLGRSLAGQRRVPPTVYAAYLSAQTLDLWIHPPQEDAPAPWVSCDGGQVWRLSAEEGRMIDERSLADAPAPYPGLVSLGSNGEGRVLVDLEAAHGLISLKGERTTSALAALAVELATNRWSDRMRITLVGFGEELAVIAPDRIRCAGSLAEVLPELEATANERGHGDDVLTGRIHGRAADPIWPPHYVLSAVAPTPEEGRRLALLARKGVRTAAGYVVAGEAPHATWNWEITEDGRALVDALGFDVTAQLLPRRHYRSLVELFRTADRLDGEPLSDGPLSDGPLSDGPEPQRAAGAPSVEVRILGPAEVLGPPPMEEGRAALAAELVVYLATHPAGVHPVVLGGILWPRGVQSAVRDATIARVVDWLGTDRSGRPNLHTDDSGRLRLGPEVRTDWSLFRAFARRAQADPTMRAVLLEKALGLVRGPLLADRPRGRYAWLAADDLEYDVTAAVADAAHRLCEVRLARGEADRAVAAVRAGLLLAPDDEGLWRDLLRATHLTGDAARLRAVADGLHRRSARPGGGGMAPETEALIDELLPAWRMRSAPSA
ncbi:bacterial transcriptional activator domain-containing protein [Streptosporangium sp. NPDC048047]|uniref:bacterial transcriptional activator domain-containing protein n=1 Tax=Streptosporangium sp. NPDC048047 TaxID=3155748 RepID=UPI003428058C